MRRFRIGSAVYEEGAPDLQAALANAYARRERPLCLCREPGCPMYVARIGALHLIKRMPLSGSEHDPSCESHEQPYDLSGLGALMGSAIQLDPQSGMATLKLDFSLSKTGSRAASVPAGENSAGVTADPRRMSLRGLLHYLWHEAELTIWTSRWAGKRHWWNVRWHLVEAAGQMTVRGGSLADILFVPEPFRAENKEAIEQRRNAVLAAGLPPKSGPRKLLVLVGEVKEIVPARSGQKLVVRHLPGFPFIIDDALHRRLQARFEKELSLWEADSTSHLIVIATFGLNRAGLAIVEEIALMVVSENWIPYETVPEKRLVDGLARLREKSVKGLRYDLQPDQPIANALLQNRNEPVALFVVPAGADESFAASLDEMIAARPEIGAWVWRVGEGDMPPLPL
ncbi:MULTISPECIES: DUF1173 domain-containing protein [unclassified Mesorhizobium]|uniref:DUF1173 domain-containing protein n=1 Tax=unclassified Mesorhizobium TaxID=325217 RepID=UPI0024152C71|nr:MULTISPECIES: DUF1173 domain-containing protein [unclassified Mesorhizobium]MDG4890027.1 DUF1173 domain-containing protein [Mesorhizobium sp. WSM4887]MDG4904169.1 DUF1173 domain-containing protein [Mesorhizobium sp. WSM4962]MDG4909196.1 DUF1173 domain-containing protein [Mesorhizobium sp. WSM4898]MDG4921820.1 DUF1173 domain-containing protein [Mesorhizobium sp. WSM4989]